MDFQIFLFHNGKQENDVLCKNIRKKLENGIINTMEYDLQPTVGGKYEVHTLDSSHIVDLKERSCTCRSWELTGIPCYHALACIRYCREDYVHYIDQFYYNSTWRECYKFGLEPILGDTEWPRVDQPPVWPPKYVKQPGRPKKVRKRGLDETRPSSQGKFSKKGVKMSCRKCGGADHNARTCRAEPHMQVNVVQPRPRGRPRVRSETGVSRPSGRPRGRPSDVHILTSQEQPSSSISRPTTISKAEIARERRMARQGFGCLISNSGNVYVRAPTGRSAQTVNFTTPRGRMAQFMTGTNPEQAGSSQQSQVDDVV